MNDYSQNGEGKIINAYFTSPGTLISIGENDGKTLSNVLGLIEAGWKAYLIEPCEEPYSKMVALHKENKKVKCYNYAIGNHNGESFIYDSNEHLGSGDTSLLSTLKIEETKRWGNTQTFTEKKVIVKTFLSFLKESRIRKADFISIDCEGLDLDIFKQINLNALKTKLVCIESNNVENEKYIQYAESFGFKLILNNQCNLIFAK